MGVVPIAMNLSSTQQICAQTKIAFNHDWNGRCIDSFNVHFTVKESFELEHFKANAIFTLCTDHSEMWAA